MARLSGCLHGSTVLALGGGLPPACQASLDPWGDAEDPGEVGKVCQGTGSTANGRWYRQQQRDAATGNYQAGARTYNPATATWLSPDSYKTDGGPTNGGLANRRVQMRDPRYQDAGGDLP